MTSNLEDGDWDLLLSRIKDGKCTPFLGAGVNAGVLPLGGDIARKWATQYKYPLDDSWDLARVAQFLAVRRRDSMFPKEEAIKALSSVAPPDFTKVDMPQSVLADLPLPVYLTTNYDDYMALALRSRNKNPQVEVCRWHDSLKSEASGFISPPGYQPSVANPLVYHLHGHQGRLESLVLTEDDYLDFLVKISTDSSLLPPRVERALSAATLLFIGYRLADWNFRVIFRGLVTNKPVSQRRISVAVQLPPGASDAEKAAQKYLTEYYDGIQVRVYWGEAKDFMTELRERWEAFATT
jgi:hypothetical protein